MLTDWLNEERLEHTRTFCFLSLSLFISLFLPLSLSPPLSFSLSLTDEEGAHTLFTGQRERERERKREGEREKEGGRIVQNCYFYFEKEWQVPWQLLVI